MLSLDFIMFKMNFDFRLISWFQRQSSMKRLLQFKCLKERELTQCVQCTLWNDFEDKANVKWNSPHSPTTKREAIARFSHQNIHLLYWTRVWSTQLWRFVEWMHEHCLQSDLLKLFNLKCQLQRWWIKNALKITILFLKKVLPIFYSFCLNWNRICTKCPKI